MTTHYQGDDCPKRHCPDIGLVGWMRSGKDSIADWLIEHYGYRKMGFATALKAEVARGVGCTVAALNEEPLKSQVRQVLQVWGTEFRRGQDSNYWVRAVEEGLLKEREAGYDAAHTREWWDNPWVLTDVRFQNEIDMLRDHGFLIVHVDMLLCDVRDYFTERGKTQNEIEAMLSHPSEVEWQYAEADERLKSKRGDLPGLYEQVKLLVERHDDRITAV